MRCCLLLTGEGLPVAGWGMSSAIVDAAAGSGGSRMTIFARIVEVVGRFATWKFCYILHQYSQWYVIGCVVHQLEIVQGTSTFG
jgi:hypothetical protein